MIPNILDYYPIIKFTDERPSFNNFCYFNNNSIEYLMQILKIISKYDYYETFLAQIIANDRYFTGETFKLKCPICQNKNNLKFLDEDDFEIIAKKKIDIIDKIFFKCSECQREILLNSLYPNLNELKKIVINNIQLKEEIEENDEEDNEYENDVYIYFLNTFIKKIKLFTDFIEKFNLIYQRYISRFQKIPTEFDQFIGDFDLEIFKKFKPLLMRKKNSIKDNIQDFLKISKVQKFNKIEYNTIKNYPSKFKYIFYIPRLKNYILCYENNIKLYSLYFKFLFKYEIEDAFIDYIFIFINKSIQYSKFDFILTDRINNFAIFYKIQNMEIIPFGTITYPESSIITCIQLKNWDKFLFICKDKYFIYEITKNNTIQLNFISNISLPKSKDDICFIKYKNMILYKKRKKNIFIDIRTGKENKLIKESKIPKSKIILMSNFTQKSLLFENKIKNELINLNNNWNNFNYCFGNIDGNDYVIIYDKLKFIYLFKLIKKEFELIKIGILKVNFDFIVFINENNFLVSYVNEKNFTKKLRNSYNGKNLYNIYEKIEYDSIELLLCSW